MLPPKIENIFTKIDDIISQPATEKASKNNKYNFIPLSIVRSQ